MSDTKTLQYLSSHETEHGKVHPVLYPLCQLQHPLLPAERPHHLEADGQALVLRQPHWHRRRRQPGQVGRLRAEVLPGGLRAVVQRGEVRVPGGLAQRHGREQEVDLVVAPGAVEVLLDETADLEGAQEEVAVVLAEEEEVAGQDAAADDVVEAAGAGGGEEGLGGGAGGVVAAEAEL